MPQAIAMSDKPNIEENSEVDDLSSLQKRLEDLGVMFYTYLGVLQRDAPPVTRPPDEADEVANDEVMRKELAEKTPGFAKEVVQCSRDIDSLINEIDDKIKTIDGKEREVLESANLESMQAGEEMTEAADEAQKLLTSVRQIIAARETEP